MSARRFTDKPGLDPTGVWALPPGHPAMTEKRTLFPSTVVEVTADEPDRILVSGKNNRKLGETVEKGKFRGYALFGLSLEERATCPDDCSVKAFCYGNSVQMARRHKIGDPEVFFDRLGGEILELLDEHDGLLIRLHVLGDFPSVEYVSFWKDMLDENAKLAAYGYTHRKPGDPIGTAIQAAKDAHPERFRIRWSSDVARPDGAVVIDRTPDRSRVAEGLVCPAQTDATACCATCGFCWEPAAKGDCVAFIKHGPKSADAAAAVAMLPAPTAVAGPGGTRPIAAISLPSKLSPNRVLKARPEVRVVAPTALRVEAAYQRDLSGKSIKLIRRIVENWDWAKFKPPVCAQTPEGLFVIDGQHTAIAAASHTDIKEIPVLVVGADSLAQRADAFVSHNRDRLAMSPLQVFHAEVAAGDKAATALLRLAIEAGITIPRSVPLKGTAKPGQMLAIAALQRTHRQAGPAAAARVLAICAISQVTPIASTLVYALQMLCREARFGAVASLSNEKIAAAIRSIPDFERAAQTYGSETGQNRYRAAAVLIAKAAGVSLMSEAA